MNSCEVVKRPDELSERTRKNIEHWNKRRETQMRQKAAQTRKDLGENAFAKKFKK
jgi:hypothetical protein